MRDQDMSLVAKIKMKNLIDMATAALIIFIAIIGIVTKQETIYRTITLTISTLLFISLYQYTKNWILKSIEDTVHKEIKETEDTTCKALELNTKQKTHTNNYIDLVKNVTQAIVHFKNIASKTKEHAQGVASKAQESLNYSYKESESVKSNIAMMFNLKQKIQTIAELILELSDYIQQIGNTVGIVEDIAEQTNMLALNAAVEAARAGEHGKGFAVVAGEIRKLADESKQATTKISSLINDIEQATNSTVMATEEGTKEIEAGVNLAHNIDNNIATLINVMNDLVSGIEGILTATIDQTVLSEDVMDLVEELDKELNISASTLEESIENVKSFTKISTNLKENILK